MRRSQNLTDPAHPGKQVVLKIMNKEELRNVDGSDSLHPTRSGDVVVVSRPPYQFDAATADTSDRARRGSSASTATCRTRSTSQHNINMHATFVAGGPGFKDKNRTSRACAQIDLAPTLAFMMGIPGPQQARGAILYDAGQARRRASRRSTILDISDWHAQLTPLAETADNVPAPARSTRRSRIGGAAFLKTWFDVYEGESALTSATEDSSSIIEVAGGDTFGGATPPISNFFGDKPTIRSWA